MVRTNVASQLKATQKGARDTGLENKIDNFVNVNVNVAYSGAQRVNDWWALVRHYDPDRKDVYKDEYEVYVFYTASKTMLNEAASNALATAASKDSDLYQITIDLARQIMLPGYDLRTGEAGTTVATLSVSSAAAQSAKTGRVALLSKNLPANFVSKVKIYSGTATNGEPYLTSTDQILPEREAAWNLPEGVYTFVLYYNNSDTAWGNATVTVTAGDYFKADIRTDWSFAFARK
jgi:hypothetical protein